MSKLILIKHAKPLVDPSKPSSKWKLSDEGREAAARLVEPLRAFQIDVFVSSDEPKAEETARVVSNGLQLQATVAIDLHEHDRSNVPHLRTPEFISAMSQFFRQPDQLVLGKETARQASDRIHRSISSILESNASRTVAVVTHGTVLALFLARHVVGVDAFQIWRRMQQPSFVVLDSMELTLEVDSI